MESRIQAEPDIEMKIFPPSGNPKYKDLFYDKVLDVNCFILYKKKAIEPGFGIYWNSVLPKNLNCIDTNTYFFATKKSKLYFITDNQAEVVPIEDIKQFQKSLKEIMKTNEYKYVRKHLSPDQIDHLITANGGHSPPGRKPDQENTEKQSGFKNAEPVTISIAPNAILFQQRRRKTQNLHDEDKKDKVNKCCKCIIS